MTAPSSSESAPPKPPSAEGAGIVHQPDKTSQLDILEPSPSAPEPPYSIFTVPQKKFIIALAGTGALFSPLSGNIYFPALNVLADHYQVSSSLINLTVTTYLIFQGLAPTFIGGLSDVYGRRPLFLVCFVIYIGACIGLALQDSYAALLVLRCVQSSGSSGTVAIASALVSDIVTSAERGKYIGYVQMGTMLGPALGPLIGGLLSQFLGWRAIFWFLAIFGGVELVALIIFLPETCRRVVGNGSIPPKGLNKSVLTSIQLKRARDKGEIPESVEKSEAPPAGRKLIGTIFGSVRILTSRKTGPVILAAGFFYAGFYLVLAVLPSQLNIAYGYNPLQVSLCYLPLGVACLLSAQICGRFIHDPNFRRHAKRLGVEIKKNRQQDLTNFPIERVRLEPCLPLIAATSLFLIGLGWVLQERTSVAGPLVFVFFGFLTLPGVSQGINALVVDLNRGSAGSATAAMNISRCWLGAGAVALVDPMIKAMHGIGWVSVFVAGVYMLIGLALVYIMAHGLEWRHRDMEKKQRKQKMNSSSKNEEKPAQLTPATPSRPVLETNSKEEKQEEVPESASDEATTIDLEKGIKEKSST